MPNSSIIGTVIRLSRRRVQVQLADQLLEFSIPRKFSNLIAGDLVVINNNEIISCEERKNLIKRSVVHRTKEVVANLDHLLIVTAPPPLFNSSVIDRLITLCEIENVPVSLIINKIDLDYQAISSEIEYYRSLDISVHLTSAKSEVGLNDLKSFLVTENLKRIAFSGVSGVGKSSLLKRILETENIRTSHVSERTGQGRQTTSEVQGYLVPNTDVVIFDVPGIQNFGLSHLTNREVRDSFTDFLNFPCPYAGCQHIGENECAVKIAVASGELLPTRYQSYLQIITELERNKTY